MGLLTGLIVEPVVEEELLTLMDGVLFGFVEGRFVAELPLGGWNFWFIAAILRENAFVEGSGSC